MGLIKHLPELLSGSKWMYLTRIQIRVDLKDKLHHRGWSLSCGEMKISDISAFSNSPNGSKDVPFQDFKCF